MGQRPDRLPHRLRLLIMLGWCVGIPVSAMCQGHSSSQRKSPQLLLRKFCFDCHNDDQAEAKVNASKLSQRLDFPRDFATWRKIAVMLEQKKMPPATAEQPHRDERSRLVKWIRLQIKQAAEKHSRDPGPTTLRRLTSAEYAYTVRDLIGLDLNVAKNFLGDAVGGEGFANVGAVQFMQDSTLEQYLAAAKTIASHAVIGAGPLHFHGDAGKSGFELSAIHRIQAIYRRHGFRSAAGEGGEPFGLDRYPRAFLVAWRFKHRKILKLDNVSWAELARREKIDVRFARYVWSVLQRPNPSFPLSEIVNRWRALPSPTRMDPVLEKSIRVQCGKIHRVMFDWQTRFGQNADAKEEAPVLNKDSFNVAGSKLFEMNVNWPKGTKTAHVRFLVESANRDGRPKAIVIWKRARIQFRVPDRQLETPRPLRSALTAKTRRKLRFGKHPGNVTVGDDAFITAGTAPTRFEIPIPAGATSAAMTIEAHLDVKHGDDCIVRCTISQEEETDQGKQVSALLADPKGPAFRKWRDGVLEFARIMPQISHREPAPSDRDPIPALFDNSYNNAERNWYHYQIKYHRDDEFLVKNIIDDKTRKQLDQAWHDLLGSFDYHDAYLQFVSRKFGLDLGKQRIASIDPNWLQQVKAEPRRHIERLQQGYRDTRRAFMAAERGHLRDVSRFAASAWRRPLAEAEKQQLNAYYSSLRKQKKLSHSSATRAVLTRVLMSPDFLYRAERSGGKNGITALSDWELANRLSYFLWSSAPDQELRHLAELGRLRDPTVLASQARRMLRHAKARRLATEFFGQWFGFYRFDRYRGIDTEKFPEFTDALKTAMYEEAVSFFEYIVRKDRPVGEILFADYVFLNDSLAAHYGLPMKPGSQHRRISEVARNHRGGLLGLGAVMAVTSAPRRTSPVKRGDWVLRRILGTPVPPPPADAGSIPADDLVADGLTVKKRLAAHRRAASCRNCHDRIDPLGFALEHYDALGRFRKTYRDGRSIESETRLADGKSIAGESGLRDYLRQQKTLFQRTLCKKLVGYAFGRRESISDVLLIERMMGDLSKQARFGKLVERIVTSRQFRYRRNDGDGPTGIRR